MPGYGQLNNMVSVPGGGPIAPVAVVKTSILGACRAYLGRAQRDDACT